MGQCCLRKLLFVVHAVCVFSEIGSCDAAPIQLTEFFKREKNACLFWCRSCWGADKKRWKWRLPARKSANSTRDFFTLCSRRNSEGSRVISDPSTLLRFTPTGKGIVMYLAWVMYLVGWRLSLSCWDILYVLFITREYSNVLTHGYVLVSREQPRTCGTYIFTCH